MFSVEDRATISQLLVFLSELVWFSFCSLDRRILMLVNFLVVDLGDLALQLVRKERAKLSPHILFNFPEMRR